ncbi:DUF2309 domain-containing protein [Zunongwangia pacifica]|uniref:Probable inorganic carbon transporter subunit DabA n=1 Tax=Zunongwangia pacifica TaxID=2911062 RepID=A0A9X2CKX2_9FLAO|nr:DUF2309 domain-containing protein [Zunongwangia pacifica]MCL6217890.1 DUF2309 domain-containing protein [Zunongwangia pacifica]
MKKIEWKKSLEEISKIVDKTSPLYAYITSNQLSGFEESHFKEAVGKAATFYNAQGYPKAEVFKEALDKKELHRKELENLLLENGYKETVETYLNILDQDPERKEQPDNLKLNRLMLKWLSIFLDEGVAEWPMPDREKGFYKAWLGLARYDKDYQIYKDTPKKASEALDQIFEKYTKEEIDNSIQFHLTSLPGWVGYIKQRQTSDSGWNEEAPISILEYLAVRLTIVDKLNLKIDVVPAFKTTNKQQELSYLFLKAWEISWQKELTQNFINNHTPEKNKKIPDAQMVFCIDTRSELIRRKIEETGNYETFGYAGFFGIAMDYKSTEDGLTRKSCPPILDSAYKVSYDVKPQHETQAKAYKKQLKKNKFKKYFFSRMKNMLPSAFGYVEGTGILYGLSLVGRTLLPNKFNEIMTRGKIAPEKSYAPKLKKKEHKHDISLEEKVSLVKATFDLTGWKTFAPVIIFTGHGSHTSNNPFASSLDCGACAGNPGRHNARTLASIANEKEVRLELKNNFGINIPENTIFLGAEHNTVTDEIEIFDTEIAPNHKEVLLKITENLKQAQLEASRERLGSEKDSLKLAHKKSNNWSETRPEWGLAKNASFIIGPRELTKGHNLNGRCFLQSYDWKTDKDGSALSAIMQGPMVVTQWINNHYYFSTVDNEKFGAGSKITHNITGKFGVMQGNGSDLTKGLPLQSLKRSDSEMYHQPLRLSVVIETPTARVEKILQEQPHLQNLLDNEWIYLLVMNPEENHKIKRYVPGVKWEDLDQNTTPDVVKLAV